MFLIVIEHLATIFLIQDPSIGLYSRDSLHILQFLKKKKKNSIYDLDKNRDLNGQTVSTANGTLGGREY